MPRPLFGLPINMLDHFEAEMAPARGNGFPVPLVPHDYAVQIAEAVGDPVPEPYDGVQPYDGLQWEMHCPLCGAVLTKEEGVISEPVLTPYAGVQRKARPAVFYACWSCEYCEEVR